MLLVRKQVVGVRRVSVFILRGKEPGRGQAPPLPCYEGVGLAPALVSSLIISAARSTAATGLT